MAEVCAVLFDFGHTLVDWVWDDVLASLREAYGEHRSHLEGLGIPNLRPADELMDAVALRMYDDLNASYERRELTERDFTGDFRGYLRLAGVELPDELFRQVLRREHAAILKGALLPAATLDTLEVLRSRGYRLGMVSNMDLLLDDMRPHSPLKELEELIPVKVLSSAVGWRKPHPTIYARALAELGVSSARVLFVGDRVLEDIRTPKRLGMHAVLSHEFRQEDDPDGEADGRIATLAGLTHVLERWRDDGPRTAR